MNQDNFVKIEECFRRARITGELSDSSILKYQDSAKKFFSIISKKIEFLEIRDFEDFILAMRDGSASNSRISNVISAVKWITNNLQINNMIKRTLDLDKIKKPKIDRKEVNYLTDFEISAFIDAIEGDCSKGPDIRKVRFLALALFLLQTGARIGEALSIKIDDIDRANKEIKIIGKGKKPRTLFLLDKTIKVLDKYLALRKDNSTSLFVALNGRSGWKQTDAGRSFRRYKNLSGIKKKFTIHTLRHSFATRLVLQGVPMPIVQHCLGHSNLETTMKYYIGAMEKNQAKPFFNEKYFDFMPK